MNIYSFSPEGPTEIQYLFQGILVKMALKVSHFNTKKFTLSYKVHTIHKNLNKDLKKEACSPWHVVYIESEMTSNNQFSSKNIVKDFYNCSKEEAHLKLFCIFFTYLLIPCPRCIKR